MARHYLLRTCPPGLFLETRSGLRIHLSGDEDDVSTLLVVFGRRDYGQIPRNAICIDVGAHLGSFSLYAVSSGTAAVYSYEPDSVLYKTLLRNVEDNSLGSQIFACEAAVVGAEASTVTFYPEGNASGHVAPLPGDNRGISVKALTLTEIVEGNHLEKVDVLKLDCEGSEYDIVFGTPPEIWRRIERVRLEYHFGRADELKKHFNLLGYRLAFRTEQKGRNGQVGVLGFDRAASAIERRSSH
jgi:FkbM family methyltransferase